MSLTRAQRRLARSRADNCCEYCRVLQGDALIPFEIDHITPRRHNGSDDIDNLCLACTLCNGNKGYNIAALDPETGLATPSFNPRQQKWEEHFRINDDCTIAGLTAVGRTTSYVLKFNIEDRVNQRQYLLQLGLYPCEPPPLID